MGEKKKLKPWLQEVISDLGTQNITKGKFIDTLINNGKVAHNPKVKKHMRNVYKKLHSNPSYWEKAIKPRIAQEKGEVVFSPTERRDIPPAPLPGKKRTAYCYTCSGSLYSDIHDRCTKCNWLICPYDRSCGCGFSFSTARIDDFW